MKYLVLINPASHNKSTGRHLSVIEHLFEGLDAEFYVSKYPGDLAEKVDHDSPADILVSVGGDGTFFEILNCKDGRKRPLAILACGTGNSLAHDLGVVSIKNGIKALSTCRIRPVDLLDVELTRADGTRMRFFSASTIASGYIADTVVLANNKMKKLGRLCYPLSAFAAALRISRRSVSLTVSGKTEWVESTTGVLVSNCTFAGNFEAFPQAKVDDGKFDFMILSNGFFGQICHDISVLSGIHFYNRIQSDLTSQLLLGFQNPETMILDGEIFTGVRECKIRIVPGGIQCLFWE